MTREEAIDWLEKIRLQLCCEFFDIDREKDKALVTAIEALKQPEIISCDKCVFASPFSYKEYRFEC